MSLVSRFDSFPERKKHDLRTCLSDLSLKILVASDYCSGRKNVNNKIEIKIQQWKKNNHAENLIYFNPLHHCTLMLKIKKNKKHAYFLAWRKHFN